MEPAEDLPSDHIQEDGGWEEEEVEEEEEENEALSYHLPLAQ